MNRREAMIGAAMAGWAYRTTGDPGRAGPRIPGGNPPMRPDQLANANRTRSGAGPAPSTSIVVARRVIVIGPDDGLFVYNGVPPAGPLIVSVASVAGTDIYGNAYLAGVMSYGTVGPVFQASRLSGGGLDFLTATSAAGPYALEAQIAPGLNGLQYVFPHSAGMAVIAPSGDATGATDASNLNTALGSGIAVLLTPGMFFLNAQVTVAGAELAGCGIATVIRPGTGYAGALLAAGAKGSIRNLTVSNSGSDAITVAGGVAEWWLEDLNFASNAGWCVNATITGAAHGRIRGIRGQGGGAANGGGINLDGGTGGAITAEVNLYDIDVQNLQANPVLRLSAVTDIRCDGPLNGSVGAGVAASCILVQGACQSCDLGSIDVGGGAAAGVLVVQDAGGTARPKSSSGRAWSSRAAGPG